jgi:hypothetical protein
MGFRDDDDELCRPEIVRRKGFRGDTLVFQVQFFQPGVQTLAPFLQRYRRDGAPSTVAMQAATPSGNPQNITGWFIACLLKYQTADQDNQAVATSKTTGVAPNIITIVNAAAGIAQVQFGPLNTIALADGPIRLVYDVQGIDPSGNVYTGEHGEYLVFPDVTRATAPF